MTLGFPNKLGLISCSNNIGVQKINGTDLQTYSIVSKEFVLLQRWEKFDALIKYLY